MTRQERLNFCRTCQKKAFNTSKGIICSITNDVAGFEGTCRDYIIDEKIKALETFKKENQIVKKISVKKTKTRTPEKITRNDIYLLLASSLSATFFMRFVFYLDYENGRNMINIIFVGIVLLTAALTLLLRKKKPKNYKLFGDIKFKALFSFMITFFNTLFILAVYQKRFEFIFCIFIILSSLLLIFLSIIIVAPVNLLIRKK